MSPRSRAGRQAESPAEVAVIELLDPDAARAVRRAQRAAAVRALVLSGPRSADLRLPLATRPDKPVIMALGGELQLGDLALACRCDARVAAADTVLAPGGIQASGLLPALVDLIGAARLPELLVSAEIPATRLRQLGLVNEVVPGLDLIHAAVRYAHRLAAAGPEALAVLRDRRLPDAPAADAAPRTVDETEPAVDATSEPPDLRVVPGARSGAQTRQKILDAAAYVLRTRGYTGCRLADIAKLCGTHQTSVYHYFPSKEALVDEVLRVGVTGAFHPVRDTVEALPPEATPLDRLAAAVRAHLRVVLSSGDYATAAMTVTGELPEESRARVRGLQHEYGQYWARLFVDADEAGYLRPGINLSIVRSFVAGALNYALEWYDPAKGGIDELADQFIPMILGGLAEPDRIAGLDLAAIGRNPHTDEESHDKH